MNVNNKCRESKRKLFVFNNIKKKKKYGCINSKKVEQKIVVAVKESKKSLNENFIKMKLKSSQ